MKNPPMQSLPTGSELSKQIQDFFRQDMPVRVVEIDYADLELRVLANLTGKELEDLKKEMEKP